MLLGNVTLDPALFEQLARHDEAVRTRVYDDATGQTIGPGTLVKGNPTIGVGRNVGPTGPGLRDAEIDTMLDQDVAYYDSQAATFPWYAKLDKVRATVVATIVFNVGLRKFSTWTETLAFFEAGDYKGAADHLMGLPWAAQIGQRAFRLCDMLRFGVPITR